MNRTANPGEQKPMSDPTPPERDTHDLGGLPGGPIDRHEDEPTFWDQRADAMVALLFFKKKILVDLAELRRGIESLAPDAYNTLSYYERWVGSMARVLVDKGIVSQDELDARVAEVAKRDEDAS